MSWEHVLGVCNPYISAHILINMGDTIDVSRSSASNTITPVQSVLSVFNLDVIKTKLTGTFCCKPLSALPGVMFVRSCSSSSRGSGTVQRHKLGQQRAHLHTCTWPCDTEIQAVVTQDIGPKWDTLTRKRWWVESRMHFETMPALRVFSPRNPFCEFCLYLVNLHTLASC